MTDSRNDRLLSSALRAVAEDDEMLDPPDRVEAKLLAEVRAIGRVRRTRQLVVAAAAAAVLFVAIALPVRHSSGRLPETAGGDPVGVSTIATREEATEFFPLPFSAVPVAGAHVVRMQVPRTALASFGVTAFDPPDDRSGTVPADVVVGNDGLARAVRFVRVVGIQQQEQKP